GSPPECRSSPPSNHTLPIGSHRGSGQPGNVKGGHRTSPRCPRLFTGSAGLQADPAHLAQLRGNRTSTRDLSDCENFLLASNQGTSAGIRGEVSDHAGCDGSCIQGGRWPAGCVLSREDAFDHRGTAVSSLRSRDLLPANVGTGEMGFAGAALGPEASSQS